MLESFAIGFQLMFTPTAFLLIIGGVCIGILFGASPGLTASMGMAFMLPLTYILDPISAMALLIGLYIGGSSGGVITAILINIPGTPSSIATTFDGYPMSKNGEPGKALGLSNIASFVGGMLSLVVLFLTAPILSSFAIKFGPPDYFAVSFLALVLIAGLAGDSMLKGLLSGLVGLMFATIGPAPLDNTSRFTMGISSFNDGFQLLAVLVGVYAVAELIKYSETSYDGGENITYHGAKIKGFGVKLSEFKGQIVNLLRSTAIGTGIGILPGVGGGTSNILSYTVAKNFSKHPEKFGTGIKDGIIASESANNAVTGGAMVPLLTLGIPGDAGTAILLAALTLHGIAPGPLVFESYGDMIYGLFAALVIANIAMILLQTWGINIFVKLVAIPKHYLYSVILVLCVIGALGMNNRIFDVASILISGLIGYVLYKFDFSLTPLIMGFILGPIVEINLLRGLMFTDGSFLAFFDRPITATFLSLSFLYIIYVTITSIRKHLKGRVSINNGASQ